MNQNNSKQLELLLEMVGFYRGMILDACEQELGDSPRWEFFRSRILKLFGQRGMEQKVISIMTEQSGGQYAQD